VSPPADYRGRGYPGGVRAPFRVLAAGLLAAATVAAAAGAATRPLPGLQTGPAPWPAERFLLGQRLPILGIPALTEEGQALHTHQHLDVYVNGKHVPIPPGIGFDAQLRFLSPLHTHDTSGVIHVESPTVRPFTLGQVFGVWGVRFTKTCVGGYCTRGTNVVRVYVNGKQWLADPTTIRLWEHQEIVVAYGTTKQLPKPIPRAYRFPHGY
jgi:hypothetical protein